MFKNRYFIFAGILAIIILLPLISYLSVKSGAEIRRNAQPSERLDSVGIPFPNYFFISQRGDTITTERMHGKVLVFELFSASCADDTAKERHPLFELQEDYNGKTLSLRIISLITDSVFTADQLTHYSTRYAAREEWHVVYNAALHDSTLIQSYAQYLHKKDVSNINQSCPENVLLIDKSGVIRGCYNILDETQYNDLYKDVLYLIDRKI